jgi:hypothetical protein
MGESKRAFFEGIVGLLVDGCTSKLSAAAFVLGWITCPFEFLDLASSNHPLTHSRRLCTTKSAWHDQTVSKAEKKGKVGISHPLMSDSWDQVNLKGSSRWEETQL